MGNSGIQLISTQVIISRSDDGNPSKDNKEIQKTPEALLGERYAGQKISKYSF